MSHLLPTGSLSTTLALGALTLAPAPGPHGSIATPVVPEQLAFGPAEGSRMRKTFNWEKTLTIDDAVLFLNGDEMNAGSGITTTRKHRVEVLDHFRKVGEGRPQELLRRFESVGIESESEGESDAVRVSGMGSFESELTGHTVLFQWDEEEEAFAKSWGEDDSGEEAWLSGLEEDLDFRGFLPTGDVSEGDTWEVDPNALLGALRPGGDLLWDLRVNEEEDIPEGGLALRMPSLGMEGLLDSLSGDVTATFKGAVDEGLVIAIEAATTLERDIAERLRLGEERQGRQPQDYDSASAAFELKGAGTLVWDPEAQLFRSFEFDGELTYDMEASWAMEAMGGEFEVEVETSRSGTLRIDARQEEDA